MEELTAGLLGFSVVLLAALIVMDVYAAKNRISGRVGGAIGSKSALLLHCAVWCICVVSLTQLLLGE